MKTNPPAKYLVEPVKLFVAILYRDREMLDMARALLEKRFGAEDYISEPAPFDHTDFYRDEMGDRLSRVFISYRELVDPGILVEAKLASDELEKELALPDGRRRVNLDPGLIDYQKVVLASFKFGGQKIYLGRGVWADLTLYYRKGGWATFEWTFPDFKLHLYDKLLLEIRTRFKGQRKKQETEDRSQ